MAAMAHRVLLIEDEPGLVLALTDLLAAEGYHVETTPNGQTGLIREGEELGGIKLLRIGTNRVLIEHEGQKKELLMFEGFGGQNLLPKEKENLK